MKRHERQPARDAVDRNLHWRDRAVGAEEAIRRATMWQQRATMAEAEADKLRGELAAVIKQSRVEAIVSKRGRIFPDLWR